MHLLLNTELQNLPRVKSELNQAWTEREIPEQNHAGSVPRNHWHQQEPFGSVQSSLSGHHCDCLEISQCLDFLAQAVEVVRRGSYLRITNSCQSEGLCGFVGQSAASSNSHLQTRKLLWEFYLISKYMGMTSRLPSALSSCLLSGTASSRPNLEESEQLKSSTAKSGPCNTDSFAWARTPLPI